MLYRKTCYLLFLSIDVARDKRLIVCCAAWLKSMKTKMLKQNKASAGSMRSVDHLWPAEFHYRCCLLEPVRWSTFTKRLSFSHVTGRLKTTWLVGTAVSFRTRCVARSVRKYPHPPPDRNSGTGRHYFAFCQRTTTELKHLSLLDSCFSCLSLPRPSDTLTRVTNSNLSSLPPVEPRLPRRPGCSGSPLPLSARRTPPRLNTAHVALSTSGGSSIEADKALPHPQSPRSNTLQYFYLQYSKMWCIVKENNIFKSKNIF